MIFLILFREMVTLVTCVSHIPRHLNVVVHELAKFGGREFSSLWLSDFPPLWLVDLFKQLPKIIRKIFPPSISPVAVCVS